MSPIPSCSTCHCPFSSTAEIRTEPAYTIPHSAWFWEYLGLDTIRTGEGVVPFCANVALEEHLFSSVVEHRQDHDFGEGLG